MVKTLSTLVLAAVCAAPARAELVEKPTAGEVAALVAAETLIALDGMQTLDIRHHRFMEESNPFLGPHPSDMKVRLWIGGAMLGLAGAWAVAPSGPLRYFFPSLVVAVELPVVIGNSWAFGLQFRCC